ncbi:MAG: hypothetical protein RR382_02725 [Tannerellaceae bacterium]
MDKADFWEIEMYLDGLAKRNEEEWQQVRFGSYVTAQVNSTKQLKPSDILKLPSDPKTEKLDLKKLKNTAKTEWQKE